MKDNTILITGGGSGIGQGLASAFHRLSNKVIVAGRNEEKLRNTVASHSGMEAVAVDLCSAQDTERFAAEVSERFPSLNVLINNAGIMRLEDFTQPDLGDALATVETNLLAPIRLTALLGPLLRSQASATIVNVTSGLAFVPKVQFPTYCATKAALHSFSISLREQFADSTVKVVELAPPYVQTQLTGEHQATDSRAMPLDEFIAESMKIFQSDEDVSEVLVERVKPLRFAEANGNFNEVLNMLTQMGEE